MIFKIDALINHYFIRINLMKLILITIFTIKIKIISKNITLINLILHKIAKHYLTLLLIIKKQLNFKNQFGIIIWQIYKLYYGVSKKKQIIVQFVNMRMEQQIGELLKTDQEKSLQNITNLSRTLQKKQDFSMNNIL